MESNLVKVPTANQTVSILNHNSQARRYSTSKLIKAERKSVVMESRSMSGINSHTQSLFKAKLGTPPMARPPACRKVLQNIHPQ